MQNASAGLRLEIYTYKSTLVIILQLFVSSRDPSVDLAGEAEVTDAGPRF
jgi:hypothetical protein